MPIEVGKTINNFADYFLKSPTLYKIAKNPIYTALLITIILVLIVLFVFRDADTQEPLMVMSLRAGFWVFLMLLGVIFIHNKVLSEESSSINKDSEYDNIFMGGYSGFKDGVLDDAIIPMRLDADFTKL